MSLDNLPSDPRQLDDPQSIRALTHPVRLALLEALTIRGQLTATEASELLEETPTTCSFHLRQLAKYGFVEEAGRGAGRTRPWRLVDIGFRFSTDPRDDRGQVAADRLANLSLQRQLDNHLRWREERRALSDQWVRFGGHGQTIWWVTPSEADELDRELTQLLMSFRERLIDPALRPVGAAPVEFVALTHLLVASSPTEVQQDDPKESPESDDSS